MEEKLKCIRKHRHLIDAVSDGKKIRTKKYGDKSAAFMANMSYLLVYKMLINHDMFIIE